MSYELIRKFLFGLNPELSHNFSLKAMRLLGQFNVLKMFTTPVLPLPKKVFGLHFENPIGLAAGLDKNGDYIDALGMLGFGFIEVGTVTPKPQSGNEKPRLFRLENNNALINRMGFNNKGVDHLVKQVSKRKYKGILGINIGKNATTPLENAFDDYSISLHKVYPYADYITVNISSPNTPGLRHLQSGEYLHNLLSGLKKEQHRLANDQNRYVALLVKIAPDVEEADLQQMAGTFIEQKIDGVIATNTTLDRTLSIPEKQSQEVGGLSGQPLFEKSTRVLQVLKKSLTGHPISLIGSGGVMSAENARLKVEAGADLIQLYTGLIYKGPSLISECCLEIDQMQYVGRKCAID